MSSSGKSVHDQGALSAASAIASSGIGAKGLKAAFFYNNPSDEEAVYFQKLRETTKDSELLEKFSGIDHLDP